MPRCPAERPGGGNARVEAPPLLTTPYPHPSTGLTKYEPFIVRSKNLPGMLFCALTGELLGARLEEIKHHLKGRKWARAKGEHGGQHRRVVKGEREEIGHHT